MDVLLIILRKYVKILKQTYDVINGLSINFTKVLCYQATFNQWRVLL